MIVNRDRERDAPYGESDEVDGGSLERDGTSAPLPPLHIRLVWVFVSPGKLMARLAETPRWLMAMLVSAAVVGLSMALVPPELMLEVQRQAAILTLTHPPRLLSVGQGQASGDLVSARRTGRPADGHHARLFSTRWPCKMELRRLSCPHLAP